MIRRLLALGCAAACLAAPPAAQAQEADPIAAARLSAELFDLASAQSDALLMVAAAKLRKQSRVAETERTPERDGAPPAGEVPAPLTWDEMLEAALALDPDDAQIATLAEDVRAETTKGVATGRVESYTSIRPGGRDLYRPLTFTGDTYADVYVEGAGGADLNLYIHDAQGRLVCSDTDISAIAYCGWRPPAAGVFAVEVRNAGRVASTYRMMTN